MAAVVLLATAGTGCSDGGTPARPVPVAPRDTVELPPGDVAALAPIIDPLVRPLGLRLARASLVDRSTAQPSPSARHLALYAEPLTTFTDDRFIQNIAPLARAVTPLVFERWPGLESYDICQEPSPGVDDRPEPETVTVFDVNRSYALATDWDRIDLATLVADVPRGRGVVVGVASRLQPLLERATR